jgi:succinate dehydrogenase/fumarate reductase cytochrome b subunit
MNSEESNRMCDGEETPYPPETNWWCCTTYKDRAKFMSILEHLDLSPVHKQIIETRYARILQNLQRRSRNYAIVYYLGHFIITVGSLFVPALLSIQNSDKTYSSLTSTYNIEIYWITFTVSLLVTIWNGVLTLFKVDKKYYFLNSTLERLRSEGWQYMSLTGRYSGHLIKNEKPSHENQFVYFTHYVEKIKMLQIEEEYYKTDEKSEERSQLPTRTATGPSNVSWFPPSPDKPISSMLTSSLPEPVKTAFQSLTQEPVLSSLASLVSSDSLSPPSPVAPALTPSPSPSTPSPSSPSPSSSSPSPSPSPAPATTSPSTTSPSTLITIEPSGENPVVVPANKPLTFRQLRKAQLENKAVQ